MYVYIRSTVDAVLIFMVLHCSSVYIIYWRGGVGAMQGRYIHCAVCIVCLSGHLRLVSSRTYPGGYDFWVWQSNYRQVKECVCGTHLWVLCVFVN